MHLPHWHLPHAHLPHVEHSEEDAVVPYLLIGLGIAACSVIAIYLYSAGL